LFSKRHLDLWGWFNEPLAVLAGEISTALITQLRQARDTLRSGRVRQDSKRKGLDYSSVPFSSLFTPLCHEDDTTQN
jgi:hypothetical protein